VISIFDTEFVLKGVFSRELSRDFHKAFAMRQVCDYRVFEPCSWEEAKEIWKKAVHFVEAVREHLRPELAD
jgi:uncharacterized protein (UPF0332 family)